MHRLAYACILLSGVALAQPAGQPCPNPPCDPAKPADAPPAPPPATSTPAPPPAPPPSAPAESVSADDEEAAANQPWTMHIGGYVQPQYRMRQNSPVPFSDEDGFRMARVRLTTLAEGSAGNLKLSAFVEGELQPTFSLADAFATVARPMRKKGTIALDVGQMRVPISRQNLLSDSRLSFVDKGQVATIAPDRDLGARVTFIPPGLQQVKVIAGAFNGEGRNQIQNINEGFLYAARLELAPFGGPAPMQESAFVGDWASLGLSVGHNKLTPGDYHENRLYLGADVSGAYHGLSGSFEYLEVRYKYDGDPMKFPGPDYKANGFMAQVAYLLPFKLPPLHQSRLELGARVEEIDRNDTVPIPQPGDPNQSVREYTAVISAYMRSHLLKAQLAFSHFDELESQTSTGTDATYANDQVLLQVTYRVE